MSSGISCGLRRPESTEGKNEEVCLSVCVDVQTPTRHAHLDFPFLFCGTFQGLFAIFEIQVSRVRARGFAYLNEKVTQMFFETSDVLIESDESFDDHFHLIVLQMRKGGFQ